MWHLLSIYILHQTRKSFKVSSENISYIQAKYNRLIANICVICTSIDCVTFCHDIQKANICCIEQASNKNVELILLIGRRCITLVMLYVISACWLRTVLINICLFSVAYSSWVFPVLLQRQISVVINSGLNCSSRCHDSIRLFNRSFSFWSEIFIRYAVGFFCFVVVLLCMCARYWKGCITSTTIQKVTLHLQYIT